MADITIRNIPDKIMSALRIKATANDLSIEEEAKVILCRALLVDAQHSGLGSRIAARCTAENGGEMILPERSTQRPAPDPA